MITIKNISQYTTNNFEPVLKFTGEFNLEDYSDCLNKNIDDVEKKIGQIILSELDKYCKNNK